MREIDNIDLNFQPEEDEDEAAVSNQKRIMNDQCFRAQALLTGDYYLRNLHSQEVNKDMIELDERITYAAKNWKHALIEMGINETELEDIKPVSTPGPGPVIAPVKSEIPVPVKSDSKKVRRNSLMTQTAPNIVAKEADYSEYNAAELNELNSILTQFMDHAFLNGDNGLLLSSKILL